MIDSDSGRGAARAEDDRGKPTQSHISSSIVVYGDKRGASWRETSQVMSLITNNGR